MTARTVIEEFNAQVDKLSAEPALISKTDAGTWVTRTWNEYARDVRALSRALAAEGVGPGDAVAVLSGNRAEYHVADVATLALGAVAVPIYQSNSSEQVKYVLDHSESKIVFCEDPDQLAKVASVRGDLQHLEKVITFTTGAADDTYEHMVIKGRELDSANPNDYLSSCSKVKPDHSACIIYTSGTTGPPKGVVITHGNVAWTAGSLEQMIDHSQYRCLSFLPLAHIAERIVSHYAQILFGGQTWFGGGVDTLKDDLGVCRPTMFFAVPRVYEKVEAALRQRFSEMTGLKGTLVTTAVTIGERVVTARQDGRQPGIIDRTAHRLLDHLALSKVREQLGFDKVTDVISGAAPITVETLTFFHAIGVPIREVYGMTEGTGPTTLNPRDKIKVGSVGPAIPGCDVKIAQDGEILFRGGNVFSGYFKNPEATSETVVDGWLHSGDLGELDADGYLKIIGRKKDLLITAGGKNVSPQNIESGLKASPFVSQAVVIGDRRKFISALVTLDDEAIATWAAERGIEVPPHDAPEVHELIQGAVDEVNRKLSSAEQVKTFMILPADLSQETGELTPTLKVKRHVIMERYANVIDAMYEAPG